MTDHKNTKQNKTQQTTTATVHTIGQTYGGGIVFYVYDGGQHGLIAATEDQNGGAPIRWGVTNTITRARAEGVGAGKANTVLIIASQGPVDGAPFAATVCNEYSATDADGVRYGDWYLPSLFELNLLYQQKDVVGGFAEHSAYWSSLESDGEYAWLKSFFSGFPNDDFVPKPSGAQVRCIRAF